MGRVGADEWEYGDGEALTGSQGKNGVSGMQKSNSLEIDDDYSFDHPSYPPTKPPPHKKSLLFYIATIQAFVIIYRTEVFLGTTLAICIAIAFSSSYHGHHPKVNPFMAAHINHDYTAITSKYDLTLGAIDHWCLQGDDNNCRCEDPLEPMGKRSSPKWVQQHKENISELRKMSK